MSHERSGFGIKKELAGLLMQDDFGKVLAGLSEYPAKKTVNTLISFLCRLDRTLRWRSVSGIGLLVSKLAEQIPEESRIIMRRFMWMLNEESGGIGWGVPESMGEVMSKSPLLAREFNRILISYLDEKGNFLDHDPLRQGVLWGISKVGEIMPELMKDAMDLTRPYLESEDTVNRGLACIIAGQLNDRKALDQLNQLSMDKSGITIYKEGYFISDTISSLAGKALKRFS
jgi:hypothetical protein